MTTTPVKMSIDDCEFGAGVVTFGVVTLSVTVGIVGTVGVAVGDGSEHSQILQYPHPISSRVTQSSRHKSDTGHITRRDIL